MERAGSSNPASCCPSACSSPRSAHPERWPDPESAPPSAADLRASGRSRLCQSGQRRPHRRGAQGRRPKSGGALRCFAKAISPQGRSGPEVMAGPTGLGPTQIQSAYKLAGLNGGGRTVALVDAYNDPKAASDLATYRKAYGLPACTVANGCFKQVNESGATSPLPSSDAGWAEEESLDLDAVSAACPGCHILLVEASSANTADLVKAENAAAKAPGWSPSPTATAARRRHRRPRPTATTTIRGSRSPPARATAATASSTRRPRRT